MIKRSFDIIVALLGLILLWPLLAVVAILIKVDSPGPVFFTQERIGRQFRPFYIYKLRTLHHDRDRVPRLLSSSRWPAVTRVGAWIRRAKLDELPQLINVLIGDMSLVGPRPELAYYVEMFRRDYEEILKVRPGITDFASLRYVNEAALLEQSADREEEYRSVILPEKVAMAKQYVRESNVWLDLRIIAGTLWRVMVLRT